MSSIHRAENRLSHSNSTGNIISSSFLNNLETSGSSCQATNSTSKRLTSDTFNQKLFLNSGKLLTSEDNQCIKSLLLIVARGNAIITELHRLVELVPAPFRGNQIKTNQTQTTIDSYDNNNDDLYLKQSYYLDNENKFTLDDIIFDFSYFKDSDKYEAKIEANEILRKTDETFCDNFIDILSRFYLTFESIQRYASDLNTFIQELEADCFVGQSLDGLLQENEARQLLCEAYFLLGYMLLTVDNNFEGGLRERIIVSYYRYSAYGSSPDSGLDETCNLLRSTGLTTPQQISHNSHNPTSNYHRPKNYPESFFARVGVNKSTANLIIAKLQSIDIYNQTTNIFPHPDHRSTALSQQAAILFILLYFCPEILTSQRSRMREITDKFFNDNWVISVHMGELVNLVEEWAPYKAARDSLYQLHDTESVTILSKQISTRFDRVAKNLRDYLVEGFLNVESILEYHIKILNNIRDANVVLKWVLLHSRLDKNWTSKLSKSLQSVVAKCLPTHADLYFFLHDLAELERRFTTIYSNMSETKEASIEDNKTKAKEMLQELIDIFTDKRPMRYVQAGANTNLATLLQEFYSKLEDFDVSLQNSRDSIINLINDISIAQDSYSDGKNLQVAQLFSDTKSILLQIMRYLALSEDIRIILHSISDFSYCWKIMDETFTAQMQRIIKADPSKVDGLESTFLKLASAFEINLIRIQQVRSASDLLSVSQYYSSKLVSYIREVLHIIPETILELLSSIINIQTEYAMEDMPSKIPHDNLKDYISPEKRYQMLELTFNVSHFAECMSLMQGTTIGIIRINSKQLLEDGIRRELVRRMSHSIQGILKFDNQTSDNSSSNSKQFSQSLLKKLNNLNIVMNGYESSFEYIQDYLFIYGLRMWQEELSRIIKFNIEQPIEILLNREYLQQNYGQSPLDYQSIYQSTKAPIPVYSLDPLHSSFMVRLLNEILRITDPRYTIFDEQMNSWYDQTPQHEKVVDLKIFELIASSLSVTGLNALDQLCCTVLAIELQKLDSLLMDQFVDSKDPNQTNHLSEVLKSIMDLNRQPNISKQFANKTFSIALTKIAPYSDKIVNHLLSIGQLQCIRISISCVLSTNCRYEARNLYGCLNTLNTTLLRALRNAKISSQHKNTIQTSDTHILNDPEDVENILPQENAAEMGCNVEESQLVIELTSHLEWIGLTDPMNKIYNSSLRTFSNSLAHEFRDDMIVTDTLFLVLLDQCSKFHFSRIINGFIPKQSKSFYETKSNVDAQPLFYGLMTFLNHQQPYIPIDRDYNSSSDEISCSKHIPLTRLLKQMSCYVKCMLNQSSPNDQTINLKPQNMTLEAVNIILSMTELIRLSKEASRVLLKETFLPNFLLDTFQFTLCHLSESNYDISQ